MMLLALAAIMAAQANSYAPAKLVILFSAQAVAVTDYPSMERCERARVSLEAQARAKAERDMPGYKLISLGFTAYCIPG